MAFLGSERTICFRCGPQAWSNIACFTPTTPTTRAIPARSVVFLPLFPAGNNFNISLTNQSIIDYDHHLPKKWGVSGPLTAIDGRRACRRLYYVGTLMPLHGGPPAMWIVSPPRKRFRYRINQANNKRPVYGGLSSAQFLMLLKKYSHSYFCPTLLSLSGTIHASCLGSVGNSMPRTSNVEPYRRSTPRRCCA